MMGASFVAFLAKAKRYFTVYTSILLKSKTSFMGAHWYLFTLNKKKNNNNFNGYIRCELPS